VKSQVNGISRLETTWVDRQPVKQLVSGFCLPETKKWDYPLSVLVVKKILVSSGFFSQSYFQNFKTFAAAD
jgi:hypothetical protein